MILPEAIVIGASAGCMEALSLILPELPADFPIPVIIVVHLPPGKDSIIVGLLQTKCAIAVREAEDKEYLEPGTAYIAPPDYHMLIEDERSVALSTEEEVFFSRPSIDVTFESAAIVYGEGLVGIILTGANNDGAAGLAIIQKYGGICLIQDPKDAFSPMMPEYAMKSCPKADIMSLTEISAYLVGIGLQIKRTRGA